jgi:endonuclease YncB( thermonuclease family)
MMAQRAGLFAAALVAAMAAMAGVAGTSRARAQGPEPAVICGGAVIARGSAHQIIDGRTLVLADGRGVRLAGIEVPPLSAEAGIAPGAAPARAALASLVGSGEIILKRAETQDADRYSRLVGFAVAVQPGLERSIQAELVAAGLARVGVRAGGHSCVTELLRREAAARQAKLGVWASSYYESLRAENAADVLATQGHFAIVEGNVVSVHEAGATIYVNFGPRRGDFTVTILKRNAASFAAAGVDPEQLAGRRVRVRGVVDLRGGPWIEAERPEQIELIEGE